MALSQGMKNIILGSVIMFFYYGAVFPGTSLRPRAITDGSDLNASVAYTSSSLYGGGCVVSGILYSKIFQLLGPRFSMMLALTMLLSINISMILLNEIAIYITSLLAGFGSSMVWILVPQLVAENSEPKHTYRNMGIFWSLMSLSAMFGSLFLYFYAGSLEVVASEHRYVVYGGAMGLLLIGFILSAFLPSKSKYKLVAAQEYIDMRNKAEVSHNIAESFDYSDMKRPSIHQVQDQQSGHTTNMSFFGIIKENLLYLLRIV